MRELNEMKPVPSSDSRSRLGTAGFDEPTRAFIRKIKARKVPEPREWHRELKSYEHGNSAFYEKGNK